MTARALGRAICETPMSNAQVDFRRKRPLLRRVLKPAAAACALTAGTGIAIGATARATLEVFDAATRKPVPCRIHLKDGAGKPVKPEKLPFFRDHFVFPGKAELNLAPGRYTYEIERGPEHRLVRGEFVCSNGVVTAVRESLERIADLAREGWWSGELHVHRPTNDVQLLMQAEDLHIAPVITWWNRTDPWAGKPRPDSLLVRFDGNRFCHWMGGEDERGGGALLFFNLNAPLAITNAAREYPAASQYLKEARRHAGVWVDIEKPFWWDVPVWLSQGIDSVGLAVNHMQRDLMLENEAWGRPRDAQRLPPPRGNGFYTQEIYYQILNAGLRVPPSAGSASGVLLNPVGYNRAYVQMSGSLTWKKWWDGLRAGRTFISNGPLLRCRANGEWPGEVFTARKEIEIDLNARLTVREPVSAIEVIVNGRVERTVPFAELERTGSLGKLKFTESGWFLVRAIADNPKTFRFASTAPWHVEIGKSGPRVSRAAAQYFLDWIRERMGRITLADATQREEVLMWHREAEHFWEKRVREANAE